MLEYYRTPISHVLVVHSKYNHRKIGFSRKKVANWLTIFACLIAPFAGYYGMAFLAYSGMLF